MLIKNDDFSSLKKEATSLPVSFILILGCRWARWPQRPRGPKNCVLVPWSLVSLSPPGPTEPHPVRRFHVRKRLVKKFSSLSRFSFSSQKSLKFIQVSFRSTAKKVFFLSFKYFLLLYAIL